MDLISNGIEKACLAEHYARKSKKAPIYTYPYIFISSL